MSRRLEAAGVDPASLAMLRCGPAPREVPAALEAARRAAAGIVRDTREARARAVVLPLMASAPHVGGSRERVSRLEEVLLHRAVRVALSLALCRVCAVRL